MPDDPAAQPGHASAGSPVAGVISLYGYYGPAAPDGRGSSRLADAPPHFVAHGENDTLVIVDDARGFVERLRATSSNPVVYAELPGAQHGFDLFRSRRFDTLVDAIEAFAAHVRTRRRTAEPAERVTALVPIYRGEQLTRNSSRTLPSTVW